MTFPRRALAALCVVLAAAGCGGGGPSAPDVLRQTDANTALVRSGTLGLKLLVTPSSGGQPFGFELHGPFTLGQGPLPVAHMAYTQVANGQQATATLVSDGTKAHVEIGGRQVALSAAQADSLRAATARLRGSKASGGLGLDRWVTNAKVSDGGVVAGATTDKVTGQVDVVGAANALLAAAQLSGQQTRTISAADAKRLAAAVKSSSFVLDTGKQDHLLRKLVVAVDLGFQVPADLKPALGPLVGAKIDFEADLANPKTG